MEANLIKITGICLIFAGIVLSGCIKKVERQVKIDYGTYFPLNEDDYRLYSGILGKAVVTGRRANLFTITFNDSAGRIMWWQDFLKDERAVFLKNIISSSSEFPSVHLEPALPFAPWSDVVGDTSLITATEIRGDSANTHVRIMVQYEIMAVEPVATPAGTFDDCIKIRMSYSSIDNSSGGIFDGDSFWWFAKDIGFVKYELPAGSGELLEAAIEGTRYP